MNIPEVLGVGDSYQIVSTLGRGAFATVFLAYQAALDRYVALKVLDPNMVRGHESRERFRREARAVAMLSGHPNVVNVFDYGEQDEWAYLVLEYIEGSNLGDRLSAPISLADVDRIVGAVASALDYAHSRRLVHRDVKPANVLLGTDGRVVLSDFGIARLLDAQMTLSMALAGTPWYMAPEQCTAGDVDARTDIYALGAMTYQMLTGRPIFEGSMVAILQQHVSEPPPPLSGGGRAFSPAVEAAVARALAKDRQGRQPSAGQFYAELSQALRPAILFEEARGALEVGALGRAEQLAEELAATGYESGVRSLLRAVDRLRDQRRHESEVARLVATGDWQAVLDYADRHRLREFGDPQLLLVVQQVDERLQAEEARLAAERLQQEREQREREAAERLERERAERERVERERIEGERAERERLERERIERERQEREAAPAGAGLEMAPTVGVMASPTVESAAAAPGSLPVPGGVAARGARMPLLAAGVVILLIGAGVVASLARRDAGPTPTAEPTPAVAAATVAVTPTAPAIAVAPSATLPATAGPTAPAAAAPTSAVPTAAAPAATTAPVAAASTPTVAALPERLALRDGAEMVLVPAGRFILGHDGDDTAAPAHPQELPAYYFDLVLVTNARFAAFVDETGHRAGGDWRRYADPASFDPKHFDTDRREHPVVSVTWTDAQAYCAWAGKRLPTEAEWEKAGRGTDGRRWPWGDEPHPEYANVWTHDEQAAEPDTSRVSRFERGASPYGALDMIGNVRQWTSSRLQRYPLDRGALLEPAPLDAPSRVTRGASWLTLPERIEITRRAVEPVGHASKDLGFRCAAPAEAARRM